MPFRISIVQFSIFHYTNSIMYDLLIDQINALWLSYKASSWYLSSVRSKIKYTPISIMTIALFTLYTYPKQILKSDLDPFHYEPLILDLLKADLLVIPFMLWFLLIKCKFSIRFIPISLWALDTTKIWSSKNSFWFLLINAYSQIRFRPISLWALDTTKSWSSR